MMGGAENGIINLLKKSKLELDDHKVQETREDHHNDKSNVKSRLPLDDLTDSKPPLRSEPPSPSNINRLFNPQSPSASQLLSQAQSIPPQNRNSNFFQIMGFSKLAKKLLQKGRTLERANNPRKSKAEAKAQNQRLQSRE